MEKRIRFVTLFPRAGNNELTKDVGMIPYLLHKNYGFQSKLACYQNEAEYTAIKRDVKGLELDFVSKRFAQEWINGVLYLYKKAKEIDVLNLYHLDTLRLAMWCAVYKIRNPKGIIYLKLDMSCTGPYRVESVGWLIRLVRKFILNNINLISGESKRLCVDFKKKYNLEPVYIPNGYYCWNKLGHNIEKEKIILTVGRIGVYEKSTELLMETFADVADDINNYTLKLVGHIDSQFEKYINKYFDRHYDLKSRIILAGEILNKKELYEDYCRAQIFVLPSKWESFGIVIPEAMSCGCYPIVSDGVTPCEDFTDNSRLGKIFISDNKESLKEAIFMAISELDGDKSIVNNIKSYAEKYYNWDTIINRLGDFLKDMVNGRDI